MTAHPIHVLLSAFFMASLSCISAEHQSGSSERDAEFYLQAWREFAAVPSLHQQYLFVFRVALGMQRREIDAAVGDSSRHTRCSVKEIASLPILLGKRTTDSSSQEVFRFTYSFPAFSLHCFFSNTRPSAPCVAYGLSPYLFPANAPITCLELSSHALAWSIQNAASKDARTRSLSAIIADYYGLDQLLSSPSKRALSPSEPDASSVRSAILRHVSHLLEKLEVDTSPEAAFRHISRIYRYTGWTGCAFWEFQTNEQRRRALGFCREMLQSEAAVAMPNAPTPGR